MQRTLILTSFLIVGLISSQVLPMFFGGLPENFSYIIQILTMTLLAFIMIKVGQEFTVDFKNKKQYAVDYGVAFTAATFPWIFVALYFLFFLMPETTAIEPKWLEAILVARFAAPTSAGVLFTMLAASGLTKTWVYKKTRILAIFDDLDTVILMIPIQMLIVGFVWQLFGVIFATGAMIIFGILYYRRVNIPKTWPWILGYSFAWAALSEILYFATKTTPDAIGMHIEVLLPAFVLGCCLKEAPTHEEVIPGQDKIGLSSEEKAGLVISCSFLFLVGLSMPAALGAHSKLGNTMEPQVLVFHLLMVTLISNLGKMFVCLFYRKEASLRERLAVGVAMFPRGEVGAGILAISLSYGALGPHVTIAFLSLALNLILTALFIVVVKKLVSSKTTKRGSNARFRLHDKRDRFVRP
jgi:Kef-type K+ transport system membrane component KefB